MKKLILTAFIGMVLAAGMAAAQLSPERAGAFYFGESSPGDGFISPADLATMVLLLKGVGGDYSYCEPADSSIQDLDGDAFISPGDKAILAQWAKSIWPAVTGRAAELYIMDDAGLETATDAEFNLAEGDSISLSARAYDANNHNLRAGFGVLFHVTSANPLCDPMLEGHNPHSELTSRPDIIQDYTVHAYTQRPIAPDDGWATIKVPGPNFSALGCFYGDTIRVTASIPDDTAAGISGNRQPATVVGPSFVITLTEGPMPLVVTGISIDQPDPIVLDEGQPVQVTATCTYIDSYTDDCTMAGGIFCNATGDVSLAGCLLTANQIPGPNGGSGSVTVTAAGYPAISDTHGVIIPNDDTYTTQITGLPASAPEGSLLPFSVTRTWSDGYTMDLTAGSVCSGGCTGGDGLCTAVQAPCGAAPAPCVITDADADNSPQSVTITNDDTISSDLISVSGSGLEGSGVSYTVLRIWSDGCVEDNKAGATCSGGCSGAVGSGVCTMAQVPCAAAPAACVVTDSDATNSPQSMAGVNDDTVVSTLISPNPAAVWGTQQFILTRTYSDTCTVDLSAGAGWTVIPNTCSPAGTIGVNGLYTAPTVAVNCSELVTAPAADGPAVVSVDLCCCFFDHKEVVASEANVSEGGAITFTVDEVDECGIHLPIPGATVSVSGDCTQSAGGGPGNANNLVPTVVTGPDANLGVSDLQSVENTPTIDIGSFWLTKAQTMSSSAFTNSIPAGSTINSVTLKVICGRNGATVATDAVYYNIGAGNVNTSITCYPVTTPNYLPEQTLSLPITNLTQLNALTVGFNNTAGGGGVRNVLFDAIRLDVAYTAPGTPGITANQVPCGAGGSCTLSAVGATSDVVAVDNNDTISSTLLALTGTGSEGTAVSYTVIRNWSDGCTEDMKAGATCSGGCSGTVGSGVCTMTEAPCGAAPAACVVMDSDADNSPQSMAGTNNDTIVSTLISGVPASATEGTVINYNVTRTWSDSCTEDMKAGAACSGGCTGTVGSGTCTMAQAACTAAPAACVVTDSDATNSPQSATGINDDTVTAVNISPSGTMIINMGASQTFACTATCSDTNTENCAAGMYKSGSCGTFVPGTGLFTCPMVPSCNDTIGGSWQSVTDPTPTMVQCMFVDDFSPSISYVFPLRATTDDRYRRNAHPDQHLTVVMDLSGGHGEPSSVIVTCTGPTTVNFTCTGSAGDPDWDCTPTSTFTSAYVSPFSTYTCSVTASNGMGTDTTPDIPIAPLSVALSTVDAKGGIGGGYVGANTYDSATGKVGNGTLTLNVLNAEDSTALAGKVYVQVIQGATVNQYFTDATGSLTINNLLPQRIDEISLGYKCGLQRCESLLHPAGRATPVRSAYNDYYKFKTWQTLDARRLILPLPLMDSARAGRNRATITGTIPETTMRNYIGPRTGVDANPLFRPIALPPVRIRGVLVFTTPSDTIQLDGGIESLLQIPDYDTSLAICIDNNPSPKIDFRLKTAWPSNFLVPEYYRTDWHNACNAWNTNVSNGRFQIWNQNPGSFQVIWALGVYINSTTFSVGQTFDLFSMPLYATAIGLHGLNISTSLRNTPYTTGIGLSADLEQDLREDWDNDPLGVDFDTAVNRKYNINIMPSLPYDPARAGSRTYGVTYRLPNLTDSELITKFAVLNWDQRFYRSHVAIISGADFGPTIGFGIMGANRQPKIDDAEFTVFMVGYMQSTGASSYKAGNRSVRYWSGSTGDSEVVSAQHAGGTNAWTNVTWGTTTLDWDPVDFGGPTNYLAIAALTRGNFYDGVQSSNMVNPIDFSLSPITLPLNPGKSITVMHVGDPASNGNENIGVGDFLNLSIPIAPATDTWIYPAPQWSNTITASSPINRNGELWPDRTVTATNSLPTDALKNNRYYVEFTRAGLFKNTGRTTPDLWLTRLKESSLLTLDGTTVTGWRSKPYARTAIASTGGMASGTVGIFQNVVDINSFVLPAKVPYRQFRWTRMGIQQGDSLVIHSHKVDCDARLVICRVDNDSQVTVAETMADCGTSTFVNWTTLACTDPDVGGAVVRNIQTLPHVRFRIVRQKPQGENNFDDWFAGANGFWEAEGPGSGSGNIRVHLPSVSAGPATLNGTTGYIPDILEGMVAATELEWEYGAVIFNSDAATLGGLGRKFNYDNRVLYREFVQAQFRSSDSRYVRYQ